MKTIVAATNRRKNGSLKRGMSLQGRRSMGMLMMALPGILLVLIFNYVPMAGVLIAFKNFKNNLGFFGSEWVGFKNFEFIFKSQDAFRIISNTLGYNLLFIITGTICAIVVALLLNSVHNRKAIKFYQTAYFLPYFISWVLVGYMARTLFEFDKGILNQILVALGMDKISWYQEKGPWWLIFILANIWKQIGVQSVIYYGSIMSIDQGLFEAAEIDGCGRLGRIRYITLPLLKPTVVILTILAVGNIMRADFGLFYYLPNNSGMLYAVTDVIDTYIYRALRETGNISGSAAVGLFQSAIGFALVMITNFFAKKADESLALI